MASQSGGWPWKGRSSLPSQLSSCSNRDNLSSPTATLTPEATKAAQHNHVGKEEKKQNPKGHIKDVPYGLALFYSIQMTHLPHVNSFHFSLLQPPLPLSVLQMVKSEPNPFSVWAYSYSGFLDNPEFEGN